MRAAPCKEGALLVIAIMSRADGPRARKLRTNRAVPGAVTAIRRRMRARHAGALLSGDGPVREARWQERGPPATEIRARGGPTPLPHQRSLETARCVDCRWSVNAERDPSIWRR